MGFRSYIRQFLGASLMLFRPSLPWCFSIQELRHTRCSYSNPHLIHLLQQPAFDTLDALLSQQPQQPAFDTLHALLSQQPAFDTLHALLSQQPKIV